MIRTMNDPSDDKITAAYMAGLLSGQNSKGKGVQRAADLNKINELEALVQKSSINYDKLKELLTNVKSENTRLKLVKEQLDGTNAVLIAKSAEVDTLKTDLATAKQEAEAAKEKAGAKEAETDTANQEAEAAKQEAEAAKQEAEAAKQEAEAAKQEAEAAKQEAAAAKEKAGAKEAETGTAKQEAEAANQEAEAAKQEAEAAKEKAGTKEAETGTANQEAEAAKQEAEAAKQEAEAAKQEAAAAKQEAAAAKQEAAAAKQEAAAAKEKAGAKETETGTAKKEVYALRKEVEQAKIDLKEAQKAAEESEAEATAKVKAADATLQEAKRIQKENIGKADALTQLQNAAKRAEEDIEANKETAQQELAYAEKAKEEAAEQERIAKEEQEKAKKALEEAEKVKKEADNARAELKSVNDLNEENQEAQEKAKEAEDRAKEAEARARAAEAEAESKMNQSEMEIQTILAKTKESDKKSKKIILEILKGMKEAYESTTGENYVKPNGEKIKPKKLLKDLNDAILKLKSEKEAAEDTAQSAEREAQEAAQAAQEAAEKARADVEAAEEARAAAEAAAEADAEKARAAEADAEKARAVQAAATEIRAQNTSEGISNIDLFVADNLNIGWGNIPTTITNILRTDSIATKVETMKKFLSSRDDFLPEGVRGNNVNGLHVFDQSVGKEKDAWNELMASFPDDLLGGFNKERIGRIKYVKSVFKSLCRDPTELFKNELSKKNIIKIYKFYLGAKLLFEKMLKRKLKGNTRERFRKVLTGIDRILRRLDRQEGKQTGQSPIAFGKSIVCERIKLLLNEEPSPRTPPRRRTNNSVSEQKNRYRRDDPRSVLSAGGTARDKADLRPRKPENPEMGPRVSEMIRRVNFEYNVAGVDWTLKDVQNYDPQTDDFIIRTRKDDIKKDDVVKYNNIFWSIEDFTTYTNKATTVSLTRYNSEGIVRIPPKELRLKGNGGGARYSSRYSTNGKIGEFVLLEKRVQRRFSTGNFQSTIRF